MIINHYGLGMVKIQQGETVLVFNPISEVPRGREDLKTLKFGADIALVSIKRPGYNGVANAARGERVPFLVDGPGEYEIGGIFIKGFATVGPASSADKPGGQINTAYLVTFEQVRILHLGALADPKLPEKLSEGAGVIDILFLPVGNGELITPKQASQLIAGLEPALVIPVDYSEKTLSVFLKEMGAEKEKPVESLTVKKKDLVLGQTRVTVIKSY